MAIHSRNTSILSVLILGGALGASAFAQNGQAGVQATTPSASATATQNTSATQTAMSPTDPSTYATGKPLEMQSKEGFWGHLNPLARKKWVRRQVAPLEDRTNELDQLQAKNRTDIHDVDSRAQAGISKAMDAANAADQHALDASNRANTAQGMATTASTRTDALNTTVGSLDQYQTVTSTAVNFVPGHSTLTSKAKASLDEMADKLATEKGYIIEVQGYSRSGVALSQSMADAVTRYLVTDHQVPIYRIYRTGMGRSTSKTAEGQKMIANGVRVTLLHNSLASMTNGTTAQNVEPTNPATGSATPTTTATSTAAPATTTTGSAATVGTSTPQ